MKEFLRSVDEQYLETVDRVLTYGKEKTDPQKVGNLMVPGLHMRFDLSEGQFPLITVRSLKSSWRAMVGELLWFISGSSNVTDLQKQNIHIWDQWAEATEKDLGYPSGELGPVY